MCCRCPGRTTAIDRLIGASVYASGEYMVTNNLSERELLERLRRLENLVLDAKTSPDEFALGGGASTSLSELNIPVYDELSNAPTGKQGSLVRITGNGSDSEGIYQYDGSQYQSTGVKDHTALSNVGADNHHIRPAPGTSLAEDANNNFNVQQGAGSGLNADQVDGFEASALENDFTLVSLNLPSQSINAGNYVALDRLTVPTGSDLELYVEGILNDAFNAPSGLNLVVRNTTDATNAYTSSTTYNEGSPITTLTGVAGDELIIAADNGNFTAGTGASQIVNAKLIARVV